MATRPVVHQFSRVPDGLVLDSTVFFVNVGVQQLHHICYPMLFTRSSLYNTADWIYIVP